MKAVIAVCIVVIPLAGCASAASFGTEVLARGVIGKIDNDGGLFGQNTSTIINSPEQQAQKARDAALKQQYPLGVGGGDKGTVIIQGQGQQQQYGGYQGGMQPAGYGGYSYGGGYGPSPYYPPY